jgi:hypothetical protein
VGLVDVGVANKANAASLGISGSTAKNYHKNILNKLPLENRVLIAAFALRQGLTSRPTRDFTLTTAPGSRHARRHQLAAASWPGHDP